MILELNIERKKIAALYLSMIATESYKSWMAKKDHIRQAFNAARS